MNTLKRAALLIIGIALLGGVAGYAIPLPDTLPISTSLNIAMAVLFIGSSIIFLRSLGGFSKQFIRAYTLICVGITLLGIAQLQPPISTLLGFQQEYWYTVALSPLTYFGAILTIFAGTRSFARLFHIKNVTTSWIFSFVTLAIVASIVSILPHGPIVSTESQFDTNATGALASIIFFTLATLHLVQVRRVASIVYTNALAWLILGFGLTTMTGVSYVTFRFLGESDFFFAVNPLMVGLLFTLSGLALLRAAYSFGGIQSDTTLTLPRSSRSFFGSGRKISHESTISSVDIVTFVANLASDSRAIDPIMDRVRIMTANRNADSLLSAKDEKELLGVYMALEDYLLNKENVRVFDKAGLRQRVARQLKLSSGQSTFWTKLPPINK